jgi:cathepsin E
MTLCVDAYNRYRDATGAVMDPFTGSLRITPAQFSNLKSLFFEIGGRPFEFTPNAQIWPRALSEGNKGTQDYLSLIINKAWSGKGFVCGFMFYERFYVVHDTTNKRIGFAETPFTKSDIN